MVLCGIRPAFAGLSHAYGQVAYALRTRAPVATQSIATFYAAPRLACVKPVASVHPEPGSNSSLYKLFFFFPCGPTDVTILFIVYSLTAFILFFLLASGT